MKLLTLITGLLVGGMAMAESSTDQLKYEVLLDDGVFQVRSYSPYNVAETTYNPEENESSRDAFMRLFRYISGYNKVEETIEMTTPVTDQQSIEIEMTVPVTDEQQGAEVVMHFMIPSRFASDEIPVPLDPKVQIVEVPARKMATIVFSGYDNESKRAIKEKQLRRWIASQDNIEIIEGPIFAGYDAPNVPANERRNEVMFVIEEI